MTCRSVTAAIPTVHVGQQTFSFYRRHKVTFNERDKPVGLPDAPDHPASSPSVAESKQRSPLG